MLENRRLVNIESENLDFPRRKSGVRVPSAPPRGDDTENSPPASTGFELVGGVFSMTFVWTTD